MGVIRPSFSITWLMLFAAALCLNAAGGVAALTLSGNLTPDAAVITGNQCPEYPGYHYLTTVNNVSAVLPGYNSDVETAWNTVLPTEWDPAGWTLQFSNEALPANLNVSTYRPYDDSLSSGLGGAEISVEWNPTADQLNLEWIQVIHTNRPKRPDLEWYLDVMRLRPKLPPVYPYSYSDHHFYDKPGRYYEPGGFIYWDAYLYLASVDRTTKSATLYDGISWGFTINCVEAPEMNTIYVMITGLTGIIIRRKVQHK